MIEAPEALFLAEQLNDTIRNRQITEFIPQFSPHKFAFYSGSPDEYPEKVLLKKVDRVEAKGGMVDVILGNVHLVFTDGVNLSYLEAGAKLPKKFQMLIGFDDESCIVASIRMYGGLMCFEEGCYDAPISQYYLCAKTKPQVLSDEFTPGYFLSLINDEAAQKKSAKAFLATEQTIPGLGNGVLQDILFNARIHPKTKISDVSFSDRERLYHCVKDTLNEMFLSKGRSTETDLFGNKGGYVPVLCKDTAGKPCPRCGEPIRKENYLGGSIYYCGECQK